MKTGDLNGGENATDNQRGRDQILLQIGGKIGADPHSRGRTRDATGEPTPEEEAAAVGGPRRQIYVGARGVPYKTSDKV